MKNDPRPEKAILRKIQFIFSDILTSNFNKFIINTTLLTLVNLVNITLVHKKGVKTAEITIDLVSILSSTSKILERLLFKQMTELFGSFPYQYQRGFRRSYSAEHYLAFRLEK